MYLLTAPTTEPVTVAEAKLAARIDDDSFDMQIPRLISSARRMAEQEIGRGLLAQVWREELEDWPATTDTLYTYRPTAVAVSYWNGSAWVTLATNAYAWAAYGTGIRLAPALGTSWPTLGEIAVGPRVRVDMTVGFTSAATVDACVKTYICAMVAFWLANPEAVTKDDLVAAPFLSGLLDPMRVY